jgi:hypothetical protein
MTVANALPDMSSQLILLMFDKDWNGTVRERLEHRVGMQWDLCYLGNGRTEIKERK